MRRLVKTAVVMTTIGAAVMAAFSRPAFGDETTTPPGYAGSVLNDTGTSTGSVGGVAWYGTAWRHVKDTAKFGGIELYVPFYTYHMPYAYTAALLRSYNDFPAGGGAGLGRYNSRGNWEGMLVLEFSDSHRKPEYVVGYCWIPTWRPFDDYFKIGAGLAGFITARSDIGHYTPFPGVLPVGTIGYQFLDIQATFVPGGKNDGNVLFCWAKLSFY